MKQQTISHKGLDFVPFIQKQEIEKQVERLAKEISNDYHDKNPLIVGILNGSFIFCADLVRKLDFLNMEVEFCKVASYVGTESTEELKQLIGLKSDIRNKHVIIIEDIIDSGFTMNQLLKYLQNKEPLSIKVCTLFLKEQNLKNQVQIDYVGFRIPPEFILGYGLDFDEWGRNLEDIWVCKKQN